MSNKELVRYLINEGILKSPIIIEAFSNIDRKLFVWPGYEKYAYDDTPLPLGDTGQTISAPHMHAYMTEALSPRPGETYLEIGGGSGYQAAILAYIVSKDSSRGFVYSIEIEPSLVKFATGNIYKVGVYNRVKIIYGDGSLGWPPYYKGYLYDGIIVTAAAPRVLDTWLYQLKIGGRLIIPIGRGYFQDLIKVTRVDEKRFKEEFLLKCAFVPLRGRLGWKD